MAQRPTMLLVFSCAAFAIAGAVCRLIFIDVESRVQIAAFCAAAVLFAAPSWFRTAPERAAKFAFVWNAAAATVAIVATRIAIEGVPYKVLTVLGAIRA